MTTSVPPTPPIAPKPPEKEELLSAEKAREKSYENFPLKSRFIKEINKAISEGVVRAYIEISDEEYDKYLETICSLFKELNYKYNITRESGDFSKYILTINWLP
jgi:hypothetical protein